MYFKYKYCWIEIISHDSISTAIITHSLYALVMDPCRLNTYFIEVLWNLLNPQAITERLLILAAETNLENRTLREITVLD